MKSTQKRRERRKSWEGKSVEIELVSVKDNVMNQILDELTEILYLEFSQFSQDQKSFPTVGCSSDLMEDIA